MAFRNNPFRKKQYISSSERTKILSSKTMTKVVNTKMQKASDFKNNNTFYDRTMNHQDLLKYTQGYFQYKPCCNNEKSIVNNANQAKFSFIDLDNVVKSKVYDKHCKYKDYFYIIDDCRHQKGLITPRGKLNPTHKEKKFSYPTPIKKIYSCSELKENSCGPCDTHCPDKNHTHHFPTNSQNISYTHNHSTKPHPKPYPFPNNQTNFMSKYDLDKSLVGN